MKTPRLVALALVALAIVLALALPWRHVVTDPICVFDPCPPSEHIVLRGIESPGGLAAGLLLAAGILAAFPRRAARIGATLALAACLVWSLATALPPLIIFGESWPGPAPFVIAALAAAALFATWWGPEDDGDEPALTAA